MGDYKVSWKVLIIAVTVILSVGTYNKVLHMEEEICWNTLKATADNINNEIQIRFKDNIAILKLVANAMMQEERVESYNAINEHINMDDWHERLGNLYEMKQRQQLKGYEDVDLIEDVSNEKTGVTAYKFAENGKNSYMYYTPVGIFDWELLIVVQEQVAFASVLQLRQILYLIEFVEIALLALYFVWTLITVNQLERSKEKVETQKKMFEQLSYSDTLTMTYNRNKYNEETEKYQGMDHFQVGIAVFDLNGLKKINDEQR